MSHLARPRILTKAQRHRSDLDRIADKLFGPEPSRVALVDWLSEEATSKRSIDLAEHEGCAVRIYEFARESRRVITATRALKRFRADPYSDKKSWAAHDVFIGLTSTERLVSECLACTAFPRRWARLSTADRRNLATKLPALVSLLSGAAPLNLLEAAAEEPPLSLLEWQSKVTGPVGKGIVCTGYFAINLNFEDKAIFAVMQQWLDRERAIHASGDDVSNTDDTQPAPRWRTAVNQLTELRFRHDAKQRGLTFNQACERESLQITTPGYNWKTARVYHDQSDSDAACKAAIAEYRRIFKDPEGPIHKDWQKRPTR